jgi:hypothetical protein
VYDLDDNLSNLRSVVDVQDAHIVDEDTVAKRRLSDIARRDLQDEDIYWLANLNKTCIRVGLLRRRGRGYPVRPPNWGLIGSGKHWEHCRMRKEEAEGQTKYRSDGLQTPLR